MTNKTIKICEGTTHYLNIDCFHDGSKNEYDLTDFTVLLFMKDVNSSSTDDVTVKKGIINNNNIVIKIDSKDTINKKEIKYECRAIAPTNDVFHIMCGKIIIDKSEVPIESMIANYPTQQPQ